MSGIYVDCDCDMAGVHPALIVLRYATDREACLALVRHGMSYSCNAPGVDQWTTAERCLRDFPKCHFHANRRYTSIHGPQGHIHNVRWDYPGERAATIRGLCV